MITGETIEKIHPQWNMITGETIEKMNDEEFDQYLLSIRGRKKYVNRYYLEKHNETGIDFEEWMKMEIRHEKLKELGL